MSYRHSTITWQETMNNITVSCSLDIAVHPADSQIVFLTVPGVDGSVDGYQNKYVNIAENIQQEYGVAAVRIANPFITSHHWESNLRQALSYIHENTKEITKSKDIEIRIMAHSAGAAVVAQIAWEYPEVTRLLLINPATKLGINKIERGISEFSGDKITLLFGSKDPSANDIDKLSKTNKNIQMNTVSLEGVDHNFSGEALEYFINAPSRYLFD